VSENERKAHRIVRRYMWWSAGAGLLPIPLVDVAALAGVQLKMLAAISRIYGVPFQQNLGKAAVGSLMSATVPRLTVGAGVNYLDFLLSGAVASFFKTSPVGYLLAIPESLVLCPASAWALGKVFIQHFESGGTFLNFKSEEVKEYFRAQFEKGRRMALAAKTGAEADVPA